jgi:hypothetical protein
MPGLRLRPHRLAQHVPFHLCVVSSHVSEGTNPARLGPSWPGMTVGQV